MVRAVIADDHPLFLAALAAALEEAEVEVVAQATNGAELLALVAEHDPDIVLLDLESHVFTPLNDPLRQLAFGSTTLAVDSVLVGGDWKVRGGQVTTVDERAVLAEARERGREIVGRFDEAFQLGQQLLAPLRGGWLEALRTNVGVERKLALGGFM